jgi:hypothetical protein
MPHGPACVARDGARRGHAQLRLARPVANVRAQDRERHDARLISGLLTLPDLH